MSETTEELERRQFYSNDGRYGLSCPILVNNVIIRYSNWKTPMKKIKCQCINCDHIQFVPQGEIVDCDSCGSFINSNEDKL